MKTTQFATVASMNVNDEIQIKSGTVVLAGTISKVTEKAIEITTHSTRGELSGREFSARVWLPKKAIVDVAAPKDAQIAAYYKANRMWENTVALASWFRPDARLQSLLWASA